MDREMKGLFNLDVIFNLKDGESVDDWRKLINPAFWGDLDIEQLNSNISSTDITSQGNF